MLKETFLMAWRSVKNNKLRSGITMAIIALGIMALIGIITAIQSMEDSLRESFSLLGTNSFFIRFKELNAQFGNSSYEVADAKQKIKKSALDNPIQKNAAELFSERFHYPGAVVSIWRPGPSGQEIHYKNVKTSPQTRTVGGDENYLQVNGYTLDVGRNLTSDDIVSARYVCLLGSSLIKTLFNGEPNRALGQKIKIGSVPYLVIGVLKEKGSSAMLRADNIILTSYSNIRYLNGLKSEFGWQPTITFSLGVSVKEVADLIPAMQEATKTFRAVRKLKPVEPENFALEKSDKFAELFIGFLSSITGAAAAIGFITLIGAAIGLMNIMLVTVNERNKEVGLIKAIGGKKSFIRNQFLFESLIISVLGALMGIVAGIGLGNIFAILLKTNFIIPWNWVIFGIVLCTFVGLFAGLYPAIKASKLNPIQVLRSE